MSLPSINDNGTDPSTNLRNRSEIVSPCHQLQWKKQKNVNDYSQKFIGGFKLIVLNLPPKLTDKVKRTTVTSYRSYSQDQSIENNTKRIMTNPFKRWVGKKSSAHPSAHAITPTEVVSLKVYSIEIK